MNIKDEIFKIKSEVDTFISDFLLKLELKPPHSQELFNAIKYSLDKRGKRIRGFMVIKCCDYYKIDRAISMYIALCVEMIHSYSLIHDDMPCMDNSNTRDGIVTNHIIHGEANALLAGNSLLTLVFEVLSSPLVCLDSGVKLMLINSLSKAFGYDGVMGGQAIDVKIAKGEIDNLNIEKIFTMQSLKTGGFFAFCSSVGGLINGSLNDVNKLKTFGYNFGKMYQIIDDILDEGEDSKNTVLNFISKDQALVMLESLSVQTKQNIHIKCFADLVDYIVSFVK